MIVLEKSIYYDVPKTGGSWISEGFVHYDLGEFIVGTSHRPPKKGDKKKYKRDSTFTFIRHPVDWYRSYYASRVDKKKDEPYKFSQFLERMFAGEISPFGEKWTTLEDYLEPFLECDYIGRTEDMKDDLKQILDLIGETYDAGNLFDRPKVNMSQFKFNPSKKDVKLIEKKEKGLIERFYL